MSAGLLARSFSTRDQRLLLWLTSAAICWRWLTAMRTPMPGVEACCDLWLAAQLAQGEFAALATRWSEPWWAMLLSPLVACGVTPFVAAQLLASIVGACVLWPVAFAAERLREGSGVSAGVVALAGAGPVLAAGAGAATALHSLVVALAVWAYVADRRWAAVVLAGLAVGAGPDVLPADAGSLATRLRFALGAGALLSPLAWLSPRPPQALVLWLVLAIVTGVAITTGTWWSVGATWSPIVAVLVGVGVNRLPVLWRDIVLGLLVLFEFHTAWHQVEPPGVASERWLGRHLARRFGNDSTLVSDLPRVAWAFGSRPQLGPSISGEELARRTDVSILVLARAAAERATVTATLATTFARCELPTDLTDAALERGVVVLMRRP